MKNRNHLIFLLLVFLVSCGRKEAVSVPRTGSFEDALHSHLIRVKNEVEKIRDPKTGEPVAIPHFDLILKTAGALGKSTDPEEDVAIAYSLLGRAGDVDCKVPDLKKPLRFPEAHPIDPKTGFEWYYFGTYMNVADPEGTQGRIAVLLSMQKQRIIGLTTQQEYGLSDEDCLMFINLVTATVDIPGQEKIIRRNGNVQLPAMGGMGGFSDKGEDFYMACGPDSLIGSRDVLPLKAIVNDGEHLNIDITFIAPEGMEPRHAFFKQGIPNLRLKGTGYTNDPSPGIYYSWPQLRVDAKTNNRLIVDGIAYQIIDGGAWMDHQLMMQSLRNPKNDPHPLPFVEDPMPVNGWSWQFFNLENGHAFTGAAFQKGEFDPDPTIVYGYYLEPTKNGKRWKSTYMWGKLHLRDFKDFPVIIGDAASPTVKLPNRWEYEAIEDIKEKLFYGVAIPWFSDGSFNGQSRQIIGENPVDYRDSINADIKGTGFCESVGFEEVSAYIGRAVDRLKRER
ncbi:MAG: hypothetical protein JXR21_00175 [Candidatus Marinimicrobia bacterium]|nr:hypothetical protein [Candidatus Neomarinimicrobiota bacterium]